MSKEPSSQEKYERSDWTLYGVLGLLITVCVTTAVASIVTYFIHLAYLKYDKAKMPPLSPMAEMHRVPPEPRLQVDDAADLVKFRQAEDAILNSYGWVDPQAGRVRIPIDRAIELTAERGLPARKGGSKS